MMLYHVFLARLLYFEPLNTDAKIHPVRSSYARSQRNMRVKAEQENPESQERFDGTRRSGLGGLARVHRSCRPKLWAVRGGAQLEVCASRCHDNPRVYRVEKQVL
jgi:hypothetical protein